MAKNNEPRKSDYLRYSSLGFQMAITIGLGAWLGTYLDGKYETEKPYFAIVIILLAIAIALYQVIKEVMLLSKEDEPQDKKESNSNHEK